MLVLSFACSIPMLYELVRNSSALCPSSKIDPEYVTLAQVYVPNKHGIDSTARFSAKHLLGSIWTTFIYCRPPMGSAVYLDLPRELAMRSADKRRGINSENENRIADE